MSKKRFSSMSNIDVVKKYLAGERPYLTISTHVSEREKFRKEGEEWELDGKKYKKTNGKTVCLTKTQGDMIREFIGDGLDCHKCGMQYKWAGKNDRKFLSRTNFCESCLIDYETKLRILGIYEAYEKYKLASNELGATKDLKVKIEDTIKYFSSGDTDVTMLCNSEGFTERWKTTNAEKVVTNAKRDLEETSKRIESLERFRDECKQKYIEDATKYGLEII
jgi:hypothetical protein